MFSFLKRHPFAVEAHFESSLVLTYAIPKAQLISLIPPCLTLDTFKDEWAFIAVAMVQTTGLRPKGFPKILGNNFFLIGYRIFVRYQNLAGKNLRGLCILKSATDKKKMEFLGNIFTHYNYETIDIKQINNDNFRMITSTTSNFSVKVETMEKVAKLPPKSPFANWKEARKFAGPLPFTFTYDADTRQVLIIQGLRQNWTPKPVKVIKENVSFIRKLNLKNANLASAFIIENIPYQWKKGKIEQWKN